MSNSIVKLSVLLSANAAQASTELRAFANDAKKAAQDSQAAFNGQTMKASTTNVNDLGRSVYDATRTAGEKYKSTIETLDVLKARGAISANTFSRAVTAAGQEMKQATSHGGGLLSMVGGIKGALVGAAAAGTVYAGVLGVKAANSAEQAMVSFKVLLKSTEAAKDMLGNLQQFAGSTPFTFPEVRQGAQQMLAYGFAARDIVPMLRIVGDAASAAPQGMTQGLESITRALGQMKSKGKVSAQEMMQLTEAGQNAWEFLAKGIGKTVADTQKLVEDGVVNSATGIKAILSGMQSQTGGLMAEQSKTLTGMLSNVSDALDRTLGKIAADTMEALNVKGIMGSVTDMLTSLDGAWKSISVTAGGFFGTLSEMMPPFAGQVLAITAGSLAFAAALPFVGTGLLSVATGVGAVGIAIQAALGPWSLLLAGVTAVAGAVTYFISKNNELRSSLKSITDARSAAAEVMGKKYGMKASVFMDDSPDAAWKKNKKMAADMAVEVDKASTAMGKLGKVSVDSLSSVNGAVSPVVAEFQKLKKEMETEIGEIGLTADAKKIKHLTTQGATPEMMRELNLLTEQRKAAEDRKKVLEDGLKLTEDMKTPYETLNSEMDRLNKFLNAGAISWATYDRAMAKANDTFKDHDPLSKLINEVDKSLEDRIEKARYSANESQLRKLKQAGANDETLGITKAKQDAADAAERETALREEALKLNDSELTGMDKVKKDMEHIAELRKNGLSESAGDSMLSKVKKDYLKDLEDKNKVTAPGLALAGSQEAYKVMLNSTKVGGGQSEEAKMLDKLIGLQKIATQNFLTSTTYNNGVAAISKAISGLARLNAKDSPVATVTGG